MRTQLAGDSMDRRLRKILSILLLYRKLGICQGGWGGSSSSNVDESYYSEAGTVGWMNDYSSMKFTIHGCVYAQVNDLDDLYCQEKGSEDGTYYWYQMVNCRRAQVAFSVYASDSGSTSCNNNYYMETFHSMGGVYEFVSELESYGADKYASSDSFADYATCESDGNGYYTGLGCSEDGDFIVAKFYDQYCLSYYSTQKTLSSITSNLQSYQCYDCSGGLCSSLATSSDSCSPNDYPVCSDVTGNKATKYKSVGQQSSSSSSSSSGSSGGSSFSNGSSLTTKLKYTGGTILLISSFIMFLGILSTSRRKRRVAMQRKFRTVGPDSFDDDRDNDRKRRSSSRARSSKKESRNNHSSRSRSRSRAARGREKKKYRSSSRKSRSDRKGTWA